MKLIIKGKTYNTETSKKVCSYVVNEWTYELYQSKSGKYFSYTHLVNDSCLGELKLVSEKEVSHMTERSGLVPGDKGSTILNELKDWCDEENEDLKVTGEGGFITFDFGSWELTLDIDDINWVKMTPKGKTVFDDNELDMIEWIRSNDYGKNHLEWIRSVYLKERYGEKIPMKTRKVFGDTENVITTLSDLIHKGEINVVLFKDYSDIVPLDDLEDEIWWNLCSRGGEWEMKYFYINGVRSGLKFNKEGENYVEDVYEC